MPAAREAHTASRPLNLVFLQRLDQIGGGSRASLVDTLGGLRDFRPGWGLALATRTTGPVSRFVLGLGGRHYLSSFPRFRKPLERLVFRGNCRRLADDLKAGVPNYIVSNEWVTAPHSLEIGRRLGVPAISYVRDFVAVQRGRKYRLHEMDGLLCVCEAMRGALIGVGYDPAKVHAVYDPVEAPPAGQAPPALAALIAAAPVDKWLLYLGRISPRKNQIAALHVLKALREASGERWGMLMAGDKDEAYAEKAAAAAAELGLGEVALQLGSVSPPGWLFHLCEASLLTSKSEGLARVLIESFLCGKPGFSYSVGGLEDIYGEHLSAFVPSRNDPGEMAALMIRGLEEAGGKDRTAALQAFLADRHTLEKHVASFERALVS